MKKKPFAHERASEALRKTASLLARESVKVTTQGARAFIEWDTKGVIQRINLPMIPRDAPEDFLDALQGFLDHEVGHALNTDPVKGRELETKLSKEMGTHPSLLRAMSNIVEDTRIETCMEKEFPGSRRNLDAVRKFFVDVMQTKSLGEIPDGEEFDDQRRSYILPIYFRARAGQLVCENYMTDNDLWHYVESYDEAFPDLTERLGQLKSTLDSVRLAAEVIEKTLEETPPMDDEEEMKDGEGSGEGEGEEGEQEDESDNSGDGGSSGDGEEGEPEDGEGSGEGSSEGDGEEEGKGDDAGGSEGEGDEDGDEDGEAKKVIHVLKAFDPDKFVDFDDGMADILETIIGDIDTGEDYHVFSRDLDQIVTPDACPRAPVAEYEKVVAQTASVLKKEIRRLIAARSLSTMVPGQRRGRLHSGSLHRIMAGDDRVFSKKIVNPTRDTAITLLVDCSGSMNGSRIVTAMQAAWAFADVLNGLNVKNEVIGFTTDTHGMYAGRKYNSSEVDAYRRTMGARPDHVRVEPLYMPVFKPFNERFTQEAKRRMAGYPTMGGKLENNTDGECLRIAAHRLHQEKVNRRIMMVFSDGSPNSQVNHYALSKDLKRAVAEAEASGIETIGVGIETDTVRKYYPKSFVINDPAELTGSVLKELKAILLK